MLMSPLYYMHLLRLHSSLSFAISVQLIGAMMICFFLKPHSVDASDKLLFSKCITCFCDVVVGWWRKLDV